MSNLESVALCVLFVIVLVVIYCKWSFTYWKQRNLACFEDPIVPFGNQLLAFKEKFIIGFIVKRIYDATKRKGYQHAGGFIFTLPFYIATDPEKIKYILQRKFENFSQRLYENFEEDDPFAANLGFVGGEKWKYLRSKLTPAFTPAKIRLMIDGMIECAYHMQKELEVGNKEAVNIKQVAHCYFADVVANCGYGFKNANSTFIGHAKNLIDFSSKYRLFKLFFKTLLPKASKGLGISFYNKTSTDFFINLAKDMARFRKCNKVLRKDLFQLLLESESELNIEEMDDEASNSAKIIKEMAAQVFLFFIAGFETSAITFVYCLYELTQNSTIQDKLRDEIDSVLTRYEGKITYDAIMDMKYMRQVLDETMRKYPPVPQTTRRCVKDSQIGEAIIEKGMLIVISLLGLHRDPDYYPDPEKFDPERFSEENKQNRLPFTYLPFGEGPRICPAYNFAIMQIKVGLVVFLQHYVVSLNEKTILPIQIDAANFMLMPKSAILLDIKSRNGINSY